MVSLTDYTPRLVGLRQHIPVDSTTVPNNQITRLNTHFDLFGASFFVPVDFFRIESMPIIRNDTPLSFLVHAVRLEECLVQVLRALENYQSTIVWSIRSEVDYSLRAMEALMVRVLVHVRPWRGSNSLALWQWQCMIYTIERHQKLSSIPELFENTKDAWFTEIISRGLSPYDLLGNGAYSLASHTNFSCGTP